MKQVGMRLVRSMRLRQTSVAVLVVLTSTVCCLGQGPIRRAAVSAEGSPSHRLIEASFDPSAAVQLQQRLSHLLRPAVGDVKPNPMLDEAQAVWLRRWAAESGWDFEALERRSNPGSPATRDEGTTTPQAVGRRGRQPAPRPPGRQGGETESPRRLRRGAAAARGPSGRDVGDASESHAIDPRLREHTTSAASPAQAGGANRSAQRANRSRRAERPSATNTPLKSSRASTPRQEQAERSRQRRTTRHESQRGPDSAQQRVRESAPTRRDATTGNDLSGNQKMASRAAPGTRPRNWRGLRETYREILARARTQSRSSAQGPTDLGSLTGVRAAVSRAVDATARDVMKRGIERRELWGGASIGPWMRDFARSVKRSSRERTAALAERVGDLPRPAVGAPQVHGAGNLGAILWIAMLTVLALIGVQLRQRRGTGPALASACPAYVAPHSIQSRADVVRAFEALALRRLGVHIASWSHWRIARSLRGESEPLGTAARLYELARYAPEETAFSQAELQQARRALAALERGRV